MILETVFDYLETKGVGSEGENLFLHNMPPHVETGILIKENLSGVLINHELPGYLRSFFKVIVRSSDYVAASELMNDIFKLLSVKEKQIGRIYFQFIRPVTKPQSYRISEGNNFEVAVQFEFACVE